MCDLKKTLKLPDSSKLQNFGIFGTKVKTSFDFEACLDSLLSFIDIFLLTFDIHFEFFIKPSIFI